MGYTKLSFCLQMALEDSEQKQNLLHSVYLELEELTPVFDTESVVRQLNEIDDQVAALQHEIAEILPQIQHLAEVSLGDLCVPSVKASSFVMKYTFYCLHREKVLVDVLSEAINCLETNHQKVFGI